LVYQGENITRSGKFLKMASVGVAPTSGLREPSGHTVGVDRLPEEMNDMKIRDDKVSTALVGTSLSSSHSFSSFF
jgi:hypothetical protein